jgi:uncharacterized protein YqhQ
MKLSILTAVIFFLFIENTAASVNPVVSTTIVAPVTETLVKKKNKSSYKILKNETEKLLGRKLKLREKIGLWATSRMANDPYDKTDEKRANTMAIVGFCFGVASLLLLPLFSIPGFIISNNALNKEKNNPGMLEDTNKTLAKIGKILSIIGFVYLLVVIIVYALVIFLSFQGGGF